MTSASFLSTFSPTTGSSPTQHYSIRLLWLPLQCCLMMANGSIAQTLASSRQSSSRSTVTFGTTVSFLEEEEIYGFELRLKNYFMANNQIPIGKTPENQGRIYLSFGSHLTASQWENMDTFRSTAAVIIVLNCATISCLLKDAILCVKTVFEATFSNVVCRCVVLNPPKDIQEITQSKYFVPVCSEESVDVIGKKILEAVTADICENIRKKIENIRSLAVYDVPVRTPVDKGNLSTLSKHLLHSRYAKVKGDLFMQLGELDSALKAYGETYFSSKVDPLWRSATLESIAAARLYKLQYFFDRMNSLSTSLIRIQSEEAEWNASMADDVAEIEKLLRDVYEEFRKDVKWFKKSAIPNSLYQYLRHELVELMKELLDSYSNVSSQLLDARERETNRGSLSRNLRDIVQRFIRTSENEIDAFFKESITQLSAASATFHVSLMDREIETHNKWCYFIATRNRKGDFLMRLGIMLKLAFRSRKEEIIRKVMMYSVMLSVSCGCWRTATELLFQKSQWESERQCHHLAVEAMVFACVVEGLNLPYIFHVSKVPRVFRHWLESRMLMSKGSAGNKKNETGRSNIGTEESIEKRRWGNTVFQVLIIQNLLRTMDRARIHAGLLCVIANYLLFHYSSLLSEAQEEEIMQLTTLDAPNVPFFVLEDSSFPFIQGLEPFPLPPNVAPKSIPICGPLFTYIDKQRLPLTVLSLNGKKLDSSVVWVLGDIGVVEVHLFNSLKHNIKVKSISLLCHSHSSGNGRADEPMSYITQDVELPPKTGRRVPLGVGPQSEGEINIEGIEIQLDYMGSTLLRVKHHTPLVIPVLPRLPLLSCVCSISDIHLLEKTVVPFTLNITNIGQVPAEKIIVTAHGESCQMEDCRGCVEIASTKDITVHLEKKILEERTPLSTGEMITISGEFRSPSQVEVSSLCLIFFRLEYSLLFKDPVPPSGISSAIPVFAVVPKRVMETQARIHLEAGPKFKGFVISDHKRSSPKASFINQNSKRGITLVLREVSFFNAETITIPPASEILLSCSELEKRGAEDESFSCVVPWLFEGETRPVGDLCVDFSSIACKDEDNDYLYLCQVTACITAAPHLSQQALVEFQWKSDDASENLTASSNRPVLCSPLSDVKIHVVVTSRWRKGKFILLSLNVSNEALGALSGPLESRALVSSEIHLEAEFEFVPFVVGPVMINVSLRDEKGRTVIYPINILVY